jgi:hypothetical protein
MPAGICLALLNTSPLQAQRSQMSSRSLLAVPAVHVEVEGIDSTAAADGLDPDTLKADIESVVHEAGIPLLSQSEWQQMIGNPALVLRFELIKVSRFVYIYRMALELRQLAVLARDTTKLVHVPTWAAGSRLGSIQTQNLPQLRDRVPEMVDWFVADYWAVRDSRDTPPPARSDMGATRRRGPEPSVSGATRVTTSVDAVRRRFRGAGDRARPSVLPSFRLPAAA